MAGERKHLHIFYTYLKWTLRLSKHKSVEQFQKALKSCSCTTCSSKATCSFFSGGGKRTSLYLTHHQLRGQTNLCQLQISAYHSGDESTAAQCSGSQTSFCEGQNAAVWLGTGNLLLQEPFLAFHVLRQWKRLCCCVLQG